MFQNKAILQNGIILFLITAVFFIAFSSTAHAKECLLKKSKVLNYGLMRGINIARIWQKEIPENLTDKTIKNIQKLGFDFVRLPISEIALKHGDTDRLKQLRCDVVRLLNNDLNVIIDFHPSSSFKKGILKMKADEIVEAINAYWSYLAFVIDGLPEERIYLGLLNEPPKGISNWWNIQGKIIENIRDRYKDFSIVATDRLGGYWGLNSKMPYPFENIIYDFHFYQPMFFTHHNAHWMSEKPDKREQYDNILYPSSLNLNIEEDYDKMVHYKKTNWNKERLTRYILNGPVAWRAKTGAQVVCLEFGVYKPFIDPASKARWLSDMRNIFEDNHIPWAVWEYDGGFGLYDNKTGLLDEKAARALGLTKQ